VLGQLLIAARIGRSSARERGGARVMAAGPGDVLHREPVADARLRREYHWRKQWLMTIVRHRYKIQREDCEEIANDSLLAWHRELLTAEGVVNDRAFCEAVVRTEAIDRLRRKSVQTVDLSAAENLGVDPELDAQAGEREEIGDLYEIARSVLERREYETSLLVADGVTRNTVAEHLGLTLRQVKRLRASAQAKLDSARAALREHGRCRMLALATADLAKGRIGVDDRRGRIAHRHLACCRRCRRDVAMLRRSATTPDRGAIRRPRQDESSDRASETGGHQAPPERGTETVGSTRSRDPA
jgi:DNA-binding CsgD family transcriptional regulator